MKKVLNIVARILGGIFYPLWIPTYGMILYCLAQLSYTSTTLLPYSSTPLHLYYIKSILWTFVLTGLAPLVTILVMIRRKQITDLYITNPQERSKPYIYTFTLFGIWTYFLYSAHFPTFFFWSAVGATAALGAVTVINAKWKISAHLTGLGGLIGGILSWFLYYQLMPSFGLIALLLGIALLLMYARLYVNAHTSLQVVCGFLLGIFFTFIPNLIWTYAQ